MDERRQFDRIEIPGTANIFADDDRGNRLGRIVMLGRGGFLLRPSRPLSANGKISLLIVAEAEGIRRQVNVIHRYTTPSGEAGFQFQNLEPDAAVEIGVLIGKFFFASGGGK